SMVSRDIYYDLVTFGLPLVFFGDHGQLPNVTKNGAKPFNLMENPDYHLEEIFRHAGEIPRFAEHLRKGGAPRAFLANSDAVQFVSRATPEIVLSADQVICRKNDMRVQMSADIHKWKFGTEDLLPGDRVMCLRNDYTHDLYNGQQGIVTKIYDDPDNTLDF